MLLTTRSFCLTTVILGLACLTTTRLQANELQVNGDFEAAATGWTEWRSPWGAGSVYDYSFDTDPDEGQASLYLSAASGSFGVYQELCVEAGVPLDVSWAWKGTSAGNGWWELLLVDAPYSYEAVDDPANHPETLVVSKWETGFGGPFPAPEADWTFAEGEFVPTTDVITLVLKCGSSAGGSVEAWFDSVVVHQDVGAPQLVEMSPLEGPSSGGTTFRITGGVFPEGATMTIGGATVQTLEREGTCALLGITPPGTPGAAEVAVTTPGGTTILDSEFLYTGGEPARFVRGDCNEDGLTDVSDAICNLAYQFLGEAEGSCKATMDVNGDALIDVTDPVYFLQYAFLSGDEPVAPFPECGPAVRSQDLEVGCLATTRNCRP